MTIIEGVPTGADTQTGLHTTECMPLVQGRGQVQDQGQHQVQDLLQQMGRFLLLLLVVVQVQCMLQHTIQLLLLGIFMPLMGTQCLARMGGQCIGIRNQGSHTIITTIPMSRNGTDHLNGQSTSAWHSCPGSLEGWLHSGTLARNLQMVQVSF